MLRYRTGGGHMVSLLQAEDYLKNRRLVKKTERIWLPTSNRKVKWCEGGCGKSVYLIHCSPKGATWRCLRCGRNQ